MNLCVYMCTLPCIYLIAVVLVKGYRAKVSTERNILSLVIISLKIIRRIKICFFLWGGGGGGGGGSGHHSLRHVHVFLNAYCPVPPVTNWCKEF